MKNAHAIILNGRIESVRLLRRLRTKIRAGRRPITLATILVGQRYDSTVYVRLKVKAAADVGIRTEQHHLPERTSQRRLEQLIQRLNRRPGITGILLQLPLPAGLNADHAIAVLDPVKDVDGFHPDNHRVTPPPEAAVLHLLRVAKPKPRSRIVLLGRQSVFTEQLAARLSRQGHRAAIIPPVGRWRMTARSADVVITAVGRGPRLTGRDIKRGAIVIDVGIRHQRGKTVGDAAPSVWTVAKAVSPVPGGIGPLTVAAVLWNTYTLSEHL